MRRHWLLRMLIAGVVFYATNHGLQCVPSYLSVAGTVNLALLKLLDHYRIVDGANLIPLWQTSVPGVIAISATGLASPPSWFIATSSTIYQIFATAPGLIAALLVHQLLLCRRRPQAVLRCTGCGYSLIGITEPRCPECGLSTDPAPKKRRPIRYAVGLVATAGAVRFAIVAVRTISAWPVRTPLRASSPNGTPWLPIPGMTPRSPARDPSQALAVSADGTVAVGSSELGAKVGARRWKKWTSVTAAHSNSRATFRAASDGLSESSVACGDLPSRVLAVSGNGAVIVGWRNVDKGTEAFRWSSSGGCEGLGWLNAGMLHSRAAGVSADGNVVVGASASPDGQQAFRWTRAEGMIGLGDLPGGAFQSEANGVSADGRAIVGTSGSFDGTEAFRWTVDEGMVGLGDLSGGRFYSRALATSADGSVIVGYGSTEGGFRAFRWTRPEG
ncbi:MAG TPA: hypothetical protein VGM03_17150, partial [Phycisphaerae bacterium]